MERKRKKGRPIKVGWKEYIHLPSWKIRRLKAKIDTGARSSAIHASKVEKMGDYLKLTLHPHRKKSSKTYQVVTKAVGYKRITNSGGHCEKRPLVATWVVIGNKRKKIELTVTRRENMLFRLILGRQALQKDFLVDPSQKYLASKRSA